MSGITAGDVFVIPNAPKQRGDLWVKVRDDLKIEVMDPAGQYWRGRVFSREEFINELKGSQ